MSADRDTTRIVRSWLRTDEYESADRVLDDVLALLDTTPQRRSLWPARRIEDMNTFAKLAMAAAAVVVVAIVGINLLPSRGGVGGFLPSPSPAASAPPSASPTPSQRPEPSIIEGEFLRVGSVSTGRHAVSQNGVDFSFELSAPGWSSDVLAVPPDGANIVKGIRGTATAIWLIIWSIDGVYADPCGHVPGPVVSSSTADLAAAVATLPGTELVSGPSDVLVGGRPAKYVEITIPEDIGCAPNQFFLWYDDVRCDSYDPCYRWASNIGEINRVWIIDVDGTHVWIEAETYIGAGPEVEEEIQQIIDSIQFE
jgi:hypothetical protein